MNSIRKRKLNLFAFQDYVIVGNSAELPRKPTVLSGKGAADRNAADIGDCIQVTTAKVNKPNLSRLATTNPDCGI